MGGRPGFSDSRAVVEIGRARRWDVDRAAGRLYLWCRLPEGRDAADIARAALGENLVLAPGNVFSLSQAASKFMRKHISRICQADCTMSPTASVYIREDCTCHFLTQYGHVPRSETWPTTGS
jgi:hypothetical protein